MNIDHKILLQILEQYIPDKNVLWLLGRVIKSFNTKPGIGLPLGNLTSQLFVNIYMNVFDQFVKHKLKVKHYIRYSDDFIILNRNRTQLNNLIPKIADFLENKLKLLLHPDKVFIKTIASGVNFLGWTHFPRHRIIRTAVKRRILKRLKEYPKPEILQSYLGLLKHGNTFKIKEKISSYF